MTDVEHQLAQRILSAGDGRRLLLLFDFDGTLVEFQPDPSAVVLPAERRDLILGLEPVAILGVISGRRLDDVRRRTGLAPSAYFAGLHGLEIEGHGKSFIHADLKPAQKLIQDIARRMAPELVPLPGVFIENKDYAFTVHFRESPQDVRALVPQIFSRHTHPDVESGRLRVMPGSCVLELLPNIAWHKGNAAKWICDDVHERFGALCPIYFGDDVTDLDAFDELKEKGITISTSDRVRGDYAIDGPAAVERVLRLVKDRATRATGAKRHLAVAEGEGG
jgi:trehalose-phosphatase